MITTTSLTRVLMAGAFAVLAGCGISSTRYVADADAHSVTRGRITRIAALNTRNILPLNDGVVIVLSDDGCSVTMRFADGKSAVYQTSAGDKLVLGTDGDYFLQPQMSADLP